ncbi:MAG: hypothetical protein IJ298_07915 [Ruminococcus sp.]|nr:hypothetical protein [Ruminococcus sp.]
MDLIFDENNENSHINISERRNKGVWLCAPVILAGAVIVSLSYIIDILFVGGAEFGIGETSAIAKALYGTGSVINKLISPLLSGGIALYIGGLPALSGGLIGGMLTGMGVTLSFSSGNTGAITGIFGSILAGLAAGYSVRLTDTVITLITKRKSNIAVYISPIASLIVTVVLIFIADAAAQIINGLSAVLLAATGEFSKLLLVVLLSIMITVDIGGPLYLAALVYGVASIATDEPQIMAAVTAAGSVPALSMGLASLIFRDRFAKRERIFAISGIFCGLCGLSQVAIPYYATRLQRVILPCIAGGVISGGLCFVLGCSAAAPAGGVLSIIGTGGVLYFCLAVFSGVLFSAGIMGYTLEIVENSEASEVSNNDTKLQKVTA